VSVTEAFYTKVDSMVAVLESFIADGSDQELFIASYLHGHFDLAIVKAEKADVAVTPDESARILFLEQALIEQLQLAFDNNELENNDQIEVLNLVKRLFIDI
jgi:hypothetical protein